MAQVPYFAPVLSICRCPCEPDEAGEEQLHEYVDRVGSELRDNLTSACDNVEVTEVFHGRFQVSSLDVFQIALSDHGFTETRELSLGKESPGIVGISCKMALRGESRELPMQR